MIWPEIRSWTNDFVAKMKEFKPKIDRIYSKIGWISTKMDLIWSKMSWMWARIEAKWYWKVFSENVDRVLNGILSLQMKYFLAGASKSLKNLKFLKKMTDCRKSQIHLFKTNVAEKASRTLGTAHFIQIDIEYDWIYRHF